MIVLNFSHPLTLEMISQIELLTHQEVEQVIEIPVQFYNEAPFLEQRQALIKGVSLGSQPLQQAAILVNPPSLNFITCLVLAELHGRMGYFPPIIRTRQEFDSLPPRYEVAEILNLQAIRDAARSARLEK